MAAEIWAIGVALFSVFLAGFAPIFLKFGSRKKNVFNFLVLGGLIVYVICFLLDMISLSGGDLFTLYMFSSIKFIWIAFLSIEILHERMNLNKWIGTCLIFCGILFISFGGF